MSKFAPEFDWGNGGGKRRGKDSGCGRGRIESFHPRKRGGNYGENVKSEVIRRQGGRSVFTSGIIVDFHHEPASRELKSIGIPESRVDSVECLRAVNLIDHALYHYANFELTGNSQHLNDAITVTSRFGLIVLKGGGSRIDEEVAKAMTAEYDSIIEGPKFEEVKQEVVRRRRKWGLPC
jgi:hypothetical protein